MKLFTVLFIAVATLLAVAAAENYTFQTEVSRMMDIIIHSLYSHKDIFLREVVSNSADALDKLRFAALTNTSLAPANHPYGIRIYARDHPDDDSRRILVIEDNGIGMSKQELVDNLGTIARSGTAAFMEEAEVKLSASEDNKIPQMDAVDLIGQFGVGFYSTFLVAEEVHVVSIRAPTADIDSSEANIAHEWVSRADRGAFSVSTYTPDAEDEEYEYIAEHGTRIVLILRDDDEAQGYAQEATIHEVLDRYSSFLHFPVGVETLEEETRVYADLSEEEKEEWRRTHEERIAELEAAYLAEEEEEDIDVSDLDEDELEDEEIEDEEKEEKDLADFDLEAALAQESVIRARRVFKESEVSEPLWTRSPDTVTDEEYKEFYKNAVGSKYHDTAAPTAWTHFRGEGDVNFTALLYIPKHMPWDFYQSLSSPQRTVDLYIKRVFVSNKDEEGDNLLPPYLSYMRGIVDSEDLQINVSREMLQESRAMRIIKRRLERKAVVMLEDLASNDEIEIKFGNVKARAVEEEPIDEVEEPVVDEEEEQEVVFDSPEDKPISYNEFFNEFGKTFKFGIVDAADKKTEKRLIELLRYPSTFTRDWVDLGNEDDLEEEQPFSDEKHPDTSLRAYVERMPEWQDDIYVIYGFSFEEIETSPLLERAIARGIEVLFCADPVDEMLFARVSTYDGHKIVNLGMDGLELPSDPEREDEEHENSSAAFRAFKETDLSLEDIYAPLVKHMQSHYGARITKLRLSDRLTDSPAILTSASGGPSAVQERYMKYQSVTNNEMHASMYKAKRVMEINPAHPIITGLLQQVAAETPDFNRINLSLDVLYDTAAIKSGWDIEDVGVFAGHIVNMIGNTVEDAEKADADAIIEMVREKQAEEEQFGNDEDDVFGEDDLFDDEASSRLFEKMHGEEKVDL